jgi:hypothetical protein
MVVFLLLWFAGLAWALEVFYGLLGMDSMSSISFSSHAYDVPSPHQRYFMYQHNSTRVCGSCNGHFDESSRTSMVGMIVISQALGGTTVLVARVWHRPK